MSNKSKKNAPLGGNKSFASKRTMNPPNQSTPNHPEGEHQPAHGDNETFQEQDPQRRLGNFEGRASHPRQVHPGRGNRDR